MRKNKIKGDLITCHLSYQMQDKFILSKKYNVIIDPINPDLVIYSNLNFNENQIDTKLKSNPMVHDHYDMNKKFLFVSDL